MDRAGINQNPAYYDLALEASWLGKEHVNVSAWLTGVGTDGLPTTSAAGASWAAQRCGTAVGSASATAAWDLLHNTVYVCFSLVRSLPELRFRN